MYFSVANTVKRAFLIWMSVILFGNSITILSGLGTIIVITGVVIYNKVKQYEINQQLSNVSITCIKLTNLHFFCCDFIKKFSVCIQQF